MLLSELVLALTRLVETKRTTTAFINGAPGSGKSFLLRQLAQEVQKTIKSARVFGPYSVGKIDEFTRQFGTDLHGQYYLETQIPDERQPDVLGAFEWLKQCLQLPKQSTLVIFVDLDYEMKSMEEWRWWFSSFRALEHTMADAPFRLSVIVSSCWNHKALEQYYNDIRLSFPYTVGNNYFPWLGIDAQAAGEILKRHFPKTLNIPYADFLCEVAGGQPGPLADILGYISKDQGISLPAIVDATKQAARRGKMAQTLLCQWVGLPDKAKAIIKHLLHMRRIPGEALRNHMDGLVSAGLLVERDLAGTRYGCFRSWYV